MELASTGSTNAPKYYSMDMSKDFIPMSVFSESAQGIWLFLLRKTYLQNSCFLWLLFLKAYFCLKVNGINSALNHLSASFQTIVYLNELCAMMTLFRVKHADWHIYLE